MLLAERQAFLAECSTPPGESHTGKLTLVFRILHEESTLRYGIKEIPKRG